MELQQRVPETLKSAAAGAHVRRFLYSPLILESPHAGVLPTVVDVSASPPSSPILNSKSEGQLDSLDVYFNAVPHSMIMDLKQGTMESLRDGSIDTIFHLDKFVHSQSVVGSKIAKGHYTDDTQIIYSTMSSMSCVTRPDTHTASNVFCSFLR